MHNVQSFIQSCTLYIYVQSKNITRQHPDDKLNVKEE